MLAFDIVRTAVAGDSNRNKQIEAPTGPSLTSTLQLPLKTLYIAALVPLLAANWLILRRIRPHFDGLLSPILGWIVGLVVFLVTPLVVITMNGGYTISPFYDIREYWGTVDLSRTLFAPPFFFIWSALMLTFLSVYLFLGSPDVSRPTVSLTFNILKLKKIILCTAGLSTFNWLLGISLAGGIESYFTSHWLYRQEDLVERFGEWFLVLGRLGQANQTIFAASSVLYFMQHLRGGGLGGWLTPLILLFFLLEVLMSGNRIYLALFLLAFLASCWVLRKRRFLIAFAAVAPVLLLFFSAWASFRSDLTKLSEKAPDYLAAELGNRALTPIMDGTEGQNVMQLLYIINDFGTKFDYLYGITYTKGLTFLVPRSLYPNKPEHYTVIIAKLYSPGSRTSFNTTQLGELYANFGPLSLWLLPGVTLGLLQISRRLAERVDRTIFFSTVLFLQLIWYARSSFADNFVPLLLVFVLVRVFKIEENLVQLAPQSQPSVS